PPQRLGGRLHRDALVAVLQASRAVMTARDHHRSLLGDCQSAHSPWSVFALPDGPSESRNARTWVDPCPRDDCDSPPLPGRAPSISRSPPSALIRPAASEGRKIVDPFPCARLGSASRYLRPSR